jgi:dienelactone hydrolase
MDGGVGAFPRTVERTVADHAAALAPHFEVFLPDGAGPFPVVVQLHGCGGRREPQRRWAEAAVSAGWAAVTVDSYAHRGVSRLQAYALVCTGMRFRGRERAGDLYAALDWVRRQPWADSRRLAAAGWSHGGWTALDAMALAPGAEMRRATRLVDLPDEPLAGLVGAFLVYPYVGPGCLAVRSGLRCPAAVMALVGGADVVVGGGFSRRRLERLRTDGPPPAVEWLAAATHAFDEPEARDMRVRHDPELTRAAMELYRGFLTSISARTDA